MCSTYDNSAFVWVSDWRCEMYCEIFGTTLGETETLETLFRRSLLQNPDSVSDLSHVGAKFEVRACHFWQDEVL